MRELMDSGQSWSGRERKCCYLNLGDGRFVDGSVVSGFDHPDDGRALARVDWDQDGDLDAWFKNRTGPQLRFQRNRMTNPGNWISFQLVGKTCNRDAVGACVELAAGGQTWRRCVTNGDGYLSQSSRELHFGLGAAPNVDRLIVHWPGGESIFCDPPPLGRRYRLVQGEELNPLPARPVLPLPAGELLADASTDARIVLRMPLPLSPVWTSMFQRGDERPKWLVPWATWCAPCLKELANLAEQAVPLTDVSVILLNLDDPERHPEAERQLAQILDDRPGTASFRRENATPAQKTALQILIGHIREKSPEQFPLPASFLIDHKDELQITYLGAIAPKSVLADATSFGRDMVQPAARGIYPGRWYARIPRDFAALSRELDAANLPIDAAFYKNLHQPTSAPSR